MKIVNLVYKIKKAKTEKSCAVDRLKMAFIKKKKVLKYLPSCKYVNPLQKSYLTFPLEKIQVCTIIFRQLQNNYAPKYAEN